MTDDTEIKTLLFVSNLTASESDLWRFHVYICISIRAVKKYNDTLFIFPKMLDLDNPHTHAIRVFLLQKMINVGPTSSMIFDQKIKHHVKISPMWMPVFSPLGIYLQGINSKSFLNMSLIKSDNSCTRSTVNFLTYWFRDVVSREWDLQLNVKFTTSLQ